MSDLILPPEISEKFIKEVLLNADWTEEEIENISEEQLKFVIETINKRLKIIHKKSNKKMLEFFEKQNQIQQAYIAEILKQQQESETGELDVEKVAAAFFACKQTKEALEAQMVLNLQQG